MKKLLLLGLFATSVWATGCTAPTTAGEKASAEGEVITGSRIPRKGGGSDGAVQRSGQDGYKQGQIERGPSGMRGN